MSKKIENSRDFSMDYASVKDLVRNLFRLPNAVDEPDKSGGRKYLHSYEVSELLPMPKRGLNNLYSHSFQNYKESRVVALLHDVVEEEKISPEGLKELGFSDRIVNRVLLLSNKNEKIRFPKEGDEINSYKNGIISAIYQMIKDEQNIKESLLYNGFSEGFADKVVNYSKLKQQGLNKQQQKIPETQIAEIKKEKRDIYKLFNNDIRSSKNEYDIIIKFVDITHNLSNKRLEKLMPEKVEELVQKYAAEYKKYLKKIGRLEHKYEWSNDLIKLIKESIKNIESYEDIHKVSLKKELQAISFLNNDRRAL